MSDRREIPSDELPADVDRAEIAEDGRSGQWERERPDGIREVMIWSIPGHRPETPDNES